MYLGPEDPASRMSKVILEALWAMLIDAACVDDTIVYLGTKGYN